MKVFKSRALAKKAGNTNIASKHKSQLEQNIEKEVAVMSIAMPFLPYDQVRGIVLEKLGLETGNTGKTLLRKGGAQLDYKNMTIKIPESQADERATNMKSPRNIRKKLLGHSERFRIERRRANMANQKEAAVSDTFDFLEHSPVQQVAKIQHKAAPKRPDQRPHKRTPRRLFSCASVNDWQLGDELTDAFDSLDKNQSVNPPSDYLKTAPKKRPTSRATPKENVRTSLENLPQGNPVRRTTAYDSSATDGNVLGVVRHTDTEFAETSIDQLTDINLDDVVIDSSDVESAGIRHLGTKQRRQTSADETSLVDGNAHIVVGQAGAEFAESSMVVLPNVLDDSIESGNVSLRSSPLRRDLPPTQSSKVHDGAMQVEEDHVSPILTSTPNYDKIKRRSRLSLSNKSTRGKTADLRSGIPRNISPIPAGAALRAEGQSLAAEETSESLADISEDTAATPGPSDAANTSVTPSKINTPAGSQNQLSANSSVNGHYKDTPESVISATGTLRGPTSSDQTNYSKESSPQTTLRPYPFPSSQRSRSAEISPQSDTPRSGSYSRKEGRVPTGLSNTSPGYSTDNDHYNGTPESAEVGIPIEGDTASPVNSSWEFASQTPSQACIQHPASQRDHSGAIRTRFLDESQISTPTTSRPYRGLSLKRGTPWTKEIPTEKITVRRTLFQGKAGPLTRQESTKTEPVNFQQNVLMTSEHDRSEENDESLLLDSAPSERDLPPRILQYGHAISVDPLLLKRGADRLDGLPFPSGEAVRPAAAQWLHQKKLSSLEDSVSPRTPTMSVSFPLVSSPLVSSSQSLGNLRAIVPHKTLQIRRITSTDDPPIRTTVTSASPTSFLQLSEDQQPTASSSQKSDAWWQDDDVLDALTQLGVEDTDDTNKIFSAKQRISEFPQQSSHSTQESSVVRNVPYLSSSQISATQPIAALTQHSNLSTQDSSIVRNVFFFSSQITESPRQDSQSSHASSVQRNSFF